jgi:serine/threonine protein phosphatase PrpC
MRTRHFADTNTGLRRQRNEDAYLGDDELGLFLVCDGVGGRARGEVASAEAADLIWEWIKREERRLGWPSPRPRPRTTRRWWPTPRPGPRRSRCPRT